MLALLALFVALGGTSYAITLADNSVRSKHIKNGEVRGADLKSGAVTSSKVKNGSLLAADFKAGQLPTGPQGPQGPQGATGATGAAGPIGPTGPAGSTNVVMRQGAAFSVNKNSFATGTASCLTGERATGGGLYNESNVFYPHMVASYPTPNPTSPPPTGDGKTPTGWRVWVGLHDIAAAPATVADLHVYVICAAP
ncbi:MAG TPA: hypothetical protein VD931_18360 [Baekduia sp.]|nr:hypothetical protein [Baekduia sp.]